MLARFLLPSIAIVLLAGCTQAPVYLSPGAPPSTITAAPPKAKVNLPLRVDVSRIPERIASQSDAIDGFQSFDASTRYDLPSRELAAKSLEVRATAAFDPPAEIEHTARLVVTQSRADFRASGRASLMVEWVAELVSANGRSVGKKSFQRQAQGAMTSGQVPEAAWRVYDELATAVVDHFATDPMTAQLASEVAQARARNQVLDDLATKRDKINELLRAEGSVAATIESALPAPPDTGNTYALLVGIGQYEKFPDKSLRYASGDAHAVAATIARAGVPKENIKVLTDVQATRANIRNAFTNHLGRAAAGDTVLFYFSGHGASAPDTSPNPLSGDGLERFLLAYDSANDPGQLSGTAISMSDLRVFTNELRSNRQVYVIDSCYAGGAATAGIGKDEGTTKAIEFVTPGGRTKDLIPLDDFVGSVRKVSVASARQAGLAGDEKYASATFVISASKASQLAQEDDALRSSVFTKYFIDALSGNGDANGDGRLSTAEAFGYTSAQVREHTGQRQEPLMGPGKAAFDVFLPMKGGR